MDTGTIAAQQPAPAASPFNDDLPPLESLGSLSAATSTAPKPSKASPKTAIARTQLQELVNTLEATSSRAAAALGDADYAIEIRLIGPDGVTDARYFNPFNQRSINVAKATVTAQDAAAKFFMELRDVGYPGSTYTLRYNEAGDLLEGIYFQAAMQESYNVAFQRVRAQ